MLTGREVHLLRRPCLYPLKGQNLKRTAVDTLGSEWLQELDPLPAGVKKPELRPGSATVCPVTLGLLVTSSPEPVPLYAQQRAALPRHCTEMLSEEVTHYIQKHFEKLKVLR